MSKTQRNIITLGILTIFIGSFTCVQAQIVPNIERSNYEVKSVQLDSLPEDGNLTLNNIFIVGNKLTRNNIITRELQYQEGDQVPVDYLEDGIEKDRRKIHNLRLFVTTELIPVLTSSNEMDLLIKVKERWYTFPIPDVNLGVRNFNEWWNVRDRDLGLLNYGVRVYQDNVRGRNERLKLAAQFGFLRQYEMRYTIPYIDKAQRNGINILFQFQEEKNLRYNTFNHLEDILRADNVVRETFNSEITFTHRHSFYTFHNFTLGFNSFSVADTVLQLNPNFIFSDNNRQRFFRFSYFFNRDMTDFINYPLRGFSLNILAEKNGLFIFNEVDNARVLITYSKFWDLGKGWFHSSGVTGQTSTPGILPYNQYQALGRGQTLLRGYEENIIEGQHFLLNRNTLKKRLFDVEVDMGGLMPIDQFKTVPIAAYFKTFVDTGYVRNYQNHEQSQLLTDRLLYNAGLGLDVVTFYDFVLRFEQSYLGVNQEFRFTINFQSEL